MARRPQERALVTATSMYVPKGARVSFAADDFEAPPVIIDDPVRLRDTPRSQNLAPLGHGQSARGRNRKLTRAQTRTSFVDKALDSTDAPTKTLRVMADVNLSALKLFAQLDADGSGHLDLDETAKLSQLLGVNATQSEVRQAFAEMDDDGNGEVSFEEFQRWWQNVKENDRRKVRRKVRNAFHNLDRNKDGTIDKEEFAGFMTPTMSRLMNLLGKPFDLEKDWALMHRSFVERGGELTDDLLVSFSLFEKWWKFRNGIDDCEIPVIPETMALRINEAVRATSRPVANPAGCRGLIFRLRLLVCAAALCYVLDRGQWIPPH